MSLNISKGNMYDFVTHTWNTVKGECVHDCSYCYMKRWGKLKAVRFDEKELKTDLGKDNFIFVGSSNDMFGCGNVDWMDRTLSHCRKFDNNYFFQSKNPFAFKNCGLVFPEKTTFCTTIETNRFYEKFMGNTPKPHERAYYLPKRNYITIEPIMDFDLREFLTLLRVAEPKQVNIGADTGGNNLPEPNKEKLIKLIEGLNKFTTIHNKNNLKRILSK